LVEISKRHTRPSAAPPILVGKSHTVGREKERAELWAAFEVVMAGRGMMLCVSGEPGIGKTTLVEDFLTELKAEGAAGAVARGKCSERLAGTEAYLPLLEALDTLLHGQHNQSLARVLKLLAPTWYAQLVPLSGEHEESARFLNEISAASQERRKRELGQFLQEVARIGPVILFFDDLHWADVSTVDILAYLASRFDSLRVLIVTTFRPADLLLAKHPFLAVKRELEAHAQCREISLEFLSRLDIERYLSLEFPEHQFPSELSKLIHGRTEGNPLFMADLVRYLCDREVLIRVDGRWTQARTLEAIEHELPASVRSMIERKIDRLSKEDRQLLVAASVQGYEFDSAVLSKVLGLDTAEVEEQLEALERVHAFVRLLSEEEFPNRTLTLRYRFVHVLYQNALYASLQPTRKTRLAAAVARALEGYWGEQSANVAGELAVLWEAAREFGRAADYFRLAAQNASRFFAAHEAVALAGRGLAMIQTLPDTRDNKDRELSLHVVLGTNLIATKGYCGPEVERTYSRAFELCHEVVETPHLLPVLYGLWSIHIVKSKHRKAWELGKEFLDRARRQGDPAVLVGHRLVGSPLFGLGELTQAREHFQKCVSAYAPAQHRSLTWLYGQDPGMVGHVWLGWTLWLLGYPERALVHSHTSLHLSQDVSHAHSQAYALFTTAVHHQFRRESQRVHDLAKAAMELSAEQKLAYWLGMAMCPDGWAIAQQGHATEGIDMQRRGLDAVRNTGVGFIVPYFLCLLAETYGKAGEAGAGLAVLTEALALIEENEERFWEAELYRLRGELLLKEGAACDDVEQCFHQAIAIARRQDAKSLELRAAMSLSCLRQKQGRKEEAGQVLAEIFSWFTEGFDTADLKEARVLLEQYDRTTPS
jgi:predicted ATPase